MEPVLVTAAKNGNLSQVRALLRAGVDSAVQNNAPIRNAAEYGHPEVVQLLLEDPEYRVDPAALGNEAIRLAAANGHAAVVRLLLQHPRSRRQIDPAAMGNEAIRLAAQNGHVAVVQELLQDLRVDPAYFNNIVLQDAVKNGHIEVVEVLLRDSRVDPTVANGATIRDAVANQDTEMVQLLGTVPGVLKAAIDYYLQYNNFMAIRRLATFWNIYTDTDLLVLGAEIGSLQLVQSLVGRGVDPTANGNLAVKTAQQRNHPDIVSYLLTLPGVSL